MALGGLGGITGQALGVDLIGQTLGLLKQDDGFQQLADLDLQQVNKFEFSLSRLPKLKSSVKRNKAGNPVIDKESGGVRKQFTASDMLGSAFSAVKAAGDSLITKLYVYSITVPNVSFVYERATSGQYIASITYPDTVTMTFLEDEKGTVRRYLKEWETNIAFLDPNPNPQDNVAYIFRDDQEGAKRTGLLKLKSTKPVSKVAGLASLAGSAVGGFLGAGGAALGGVAGRIVGGGPILEYPKITFGGLKFKSLNDFTVGHAETNNLVYTATFSVDNIKVPLLG